QTGEEIVNLTRRAVEKNCQPVIAGGGDGTINAVASVLVDTDRTLGVLPLGTLNHFARDLKIPLDVESAARVCLEGREARVDVGEVNGRVFLNNASLGLSPQVEGAGGAGLCGASSAACETKRISMPFAQKRSG